LYTELIKSIGIRYLNQDEPLKHKAVMASLAFQVLL
jgi:hypothetical protein